MFLSDIWADQDIHYPGDSWNDSGDNLYGNFKAIYNLKKQNRHLKVLLSIGLSAAETRPASLNLNRSFVGGWTYSSSFHPVVVTHARRARFVESSVKLLEDYGLDGLDIDYEYPQNDEQASGYVQLLRLLRQGLDEHQRRKGIDYRFLLTVSRMCVVYFRHMC